MDSHHKNIEEFAQGVFENVKAHPIDHDPSEIDHPFWPIVSMFARDQMPELTETVLKNFDPTNCPKNEFLRDAQLKISFYPLHLMAFLRMKDGDIQPNRAFDPGLYKVILQFSARKIGTTACFLAAQAILTPISTACFAVSSRLPGFYDNLDRIADLLQPQELDVWEQLGKKREDSSDSLEWYLESTFEENPPKNREEMDAMCKAWLNAKKATERRKKRELAPKQNWLAATLKTDWLPYAHWCRSTQGIMDFYSSSFNPVTAEDHEAARKIIDTAISKLGLSAKRHPQHGEKILAASQKILSELAKPTQMSRNPL